jgi:hypothetical protein
MNKLKLLDLFSGIGGFSLGLESTGYFQTIAFVEKDKFCRQVLQKNFNNIPIEEDIRNVRGSNYAADVITGGFPCQPFSVAGKRKGTADDRYLWDETIRVVAECKARWFIGENVEGPTPTTMDHIDRKGMRPSRAATNRKTGYLSEMIKMYPTPTPACEEGGEQSSRVEMTDNGGFILRKKNKPEMTFGAKLSDAMLYLEKQLYNTPTTNDAKNLTFPKSQTNRTSIVGNLIQQEQIKPGGKLNPNFVEFLMGYPLNWTKTEPTE